MAQTRPPRPNLPDRVWTRLEPFVDLDDPDCRLLLESAPLANLNFSRPLTNRRRGRLESALARFDLWLAAENLPPLDALSDSELPGLAERWLAWLACPTTSDHPAVWPPDDPSVKSRRGYRATLKPYKNLSPFRVALDWWAEENGRPSPLTNHARMITSERSSEPAQQARALTDEDLVAAVAAYNSGSVVKIGNAERSRLWHAREKAAFLVSVFASLRISERGLLLDDHLVSISEEGVGIRMLRTKFHPEGRIIYLKPRPDILCPLASLTEFLQLCKDLRLDRGGYLLPAVRIVGAPLVARSPELEQQNWKRIASTAGFSGRPDVLDGTFRATSHGQRATILTRAAAASWDVTDLLRIGGWRTADSALRYDRHTGLDWDLSEAVGL